MRIFLAVAMTALISACMPVSKQHYDVVHNTPGEIKQLKQTDQELKQEIRSIKEAMHAVKGDMRQEIQDNTATVEQVSDTSAKVTLQEQLLFDSGSNAISRAGRDRLAKFAKTFHRMPANTRIRIVGHTDALPIGLELRDKYADNWDLSAARAAAVARYFVWGADIKPERLHIEGSAATQPVASNLTEKGRAKNRRIELFIEEVN